jgi:hypothetical protein
MPRTTAAPQRATALLPGRLIDAETKQTLDRREALFDRAPRNLGPTTRGAGKPCLVFSDQPIDPFHSNGRKIKYKQ